MSRRRTAGLHRWLTALLLPLAATVVAQNTEQGQVATETPLELVPPTIPAGVRAWPQYRGDGSGRSSARGLPLTWSEDHNVVWKTPLTGRGHSSPVVWGDKIWLTTALDDQMSLRVLAFDFATGRKLHDVEVFRPKAWQPDHADNSHASPTPVTDGERVCAYFGTYGTVCLANQDARILWQTTEWPQEHEVGPGSSPILWRDLLLVNCDATDSQFVLARGKYAGTVVWRRERLHTADRKPPHRKAFSTPLVIRVDGQEQLVSTGAAHSSGYDPATGVEFWRFRHEGYSNVPMPLLTSRRVLVNSGYSRPHLYPVDPRRRGEIPAEAADWVFYQQVPANPSPIVVGNRLFMVGDFGIASWLDLDKMSAEAAPIWRQRLKGRFLSSPILAEGHLYVSSLEGITTVLAASDQFEVLAENQLEGQINAIPAFVDGAIVLRTDRALYRLGLKAGDGSQ